MTASRFAPHWFTSSTSRHSLGRRADGVQLERPNRASDSLRAEIPTWRRPTGRFGAHWTHSTGCSAPKTRTSGGSPSSRPSARGSARSSAAAGSAPASRRSSGSPDGRSSGPPASTSRTHGHPSVMDIRINEVVRGHQISQARAVAIGRRRRDPDRQRRARRPGHPVSPASGPSSPQVPPPEDCPPREILDRHEGTIMDRIEMRIADARALRRARRHARRRPQRALGPAPRGARRCRPRHARDRRRLRAVRDLAVARPPCRRQQPRQHAAGREPARRPTGSSPTSVSTPSRDGFGHGLVHLWAARRPPARHGEPVHHRACLAPRPPTWIDARDPTRRPEGDRDDAAALGHHVPLAGVPLLEHQAWFVEIEDLGFTDIWSSETDGTTRSPSLVLAAAWAPTLRLGQAIVPVYTRGPALLAQTIATPRRHRARTRRRSASGRRRNVIVERWNGIPFEQPVPPRPRHRCGSSALALTGEKVTAEYDSFEVKGFRLGVRVPEQRRRSSSARSAPGCCGSPAVRATARSSTGSAPRTSRRSRRSWATPGQGDRRHASSCCRATTVTRCGDSGGA